MIRAVAAVSVFLLLAGCTSGPSLDQQQQAWDADIETQACESIELLTPGSLERGWAVENAAEGNLTADDVRAFGNGGDDSPYRCAGDTFDRYYQEWLVEDFPESPKGQAGETTSPPAP
ncbi:hypothetical protein [Dietzia sp. PP-33]|jgi:hypothetical protein|uniref:hypothetical protein n=1 Tax=Dietzia sp. PP-33 TaxID=2957500 RepID=UPI0029A5D376|nr:hypothetical protein [Dietzia sp. PP-33]MDX2358564.1 hypothetical protein [Dietzia sp. PP-33]